MASMLIGTATGINSMPPLLPKVDAILVLDGDGNRLAGKYYGDFLKSSSASAAAASASAGADRNKTTTEELRKQFEQALQAKMTGIAARADAAEVVTCQGRTAVFCGGAAGDVRVVHVGPPSESELVLAYLCEGMYDALSQLMGGSTDRSMVLDNLELVFLLIDEHCDGGIILEVDGRKLASAVLLRDEDHPAGAGAAEEATGLRGTTALPPGVSSGDMTLGQAFRQARDQFFVGMTTRDGM